MHDNRVRLKCLASLSLWAGLAAGCMGAPPEEPSAIAVQAQPLLGKDGTLSYSGNAPINRYSAVTADIKAGDTTIAVASAAALNVTAGDLLMIIQMQGATIDVTDTAAYGTVSSLNNAGLYELANVVSVTTNTITIDAGIACGGAGATGGLRNNYTAAGKVQAVRVPQYVSFTLPAGQTLTAPAWNGTVGGVLAYSSLSSTIDGTIDLSATGFRGGAVKSTANTAVTTAFVATTLDQGAEKGESIAGSATEYAANKGQYGRGAPANGGGGGNGHNGAGGGGSNGDNGVAWSGIGNMNATVNSLDAWKLDPEYIKGNKLTTSSGGGRGGYGCSTANQDPTLVAPGTATWGCGSRTDAGGHGGHPLPADVNTRLFLGGGGGAGDDDNGNGGSGGIGGGIVYINSALITSTGAAAGTSTGVIRANGSVGGAAGKRLPTATSDAPGGGGGGGTVVLAASGALLGVKVAADGGVGGDHSPAAMSLTEGEGAGGGGGGGYIALIGGTLQTATVTGAQAGKTTQAILVKMPTNGGTDGGAGKLVNIASYGALTPKPICAPADIQVTITDNLNGAAPQPGSSVVFTVTITNVGPNPAAGIKITDMLSIDQTSATWTCTSQVAALCPAAAGTGSIATSTLSLPASTSVVYKVTVPVPVTTNPSLSYTVTATPPLGVTDPNLGNNTATDTTAGGTPPQADLALVISRNPATAQPGTEITYTLQVTNNGPATAPSANVVFTVPPGATVTQPAQGTGWTCTNTGDTFTCNSTAPLAPGSAAPITIKLNAPQPGTPGAANPAVSGIVGGPGVNDPNPANNYASSDAGAVTSTAADLAVTITKSPDAALPGQEVTYTIQATDKGPGSVYNPSVTFTVPAGAIVTMPPAGQGWACQRNGDTFTCIRSVIDVGTAPPIVAKIITPAASGSGGGSGAVAVVISAPQNNDPDLSNNVAVVDAGTIAPTGSDLAVTLTKTADAPAPGQTTYTLQATNKGPNAVGSVAVTLSVPAGYQVVQPAQGSGWTCSFDGSSFLCTVPSGPVGDLPPITLILTSPAGPATGAVTASIAAANNNDPVPANNTATATASGTGTSDQFKLAGGGLGCTVSGHGTTAVPFCGFLAAGLLLTLATSARRRRLSARA